MVGKTDVVAKEVRNGLKLDAMIAVRLFKESGEELAEAPIIVYNIFKIINKAYSHSCRSLLQSNNWNNFTTN
jgi:hypothetical protein